jgi:hypothetical protein
MGPFGEFIPKTHLVTLHGARALRALVLLLQYEGALQGDQIGPIWTKNYCLLEFF